MLKKLLKYDFRAVLKFWWIAVAMNLLLSVTGGFISLLESYDNWLSDLVSTISGLPLFLVNCSYVALLIVTLVLLFIRFYQNLFSDEGYLTFTLPVTRSQLLNSKFITGISILGATVLICFANLLLMDMIACWPDVRTGTYFHDTVKYFVTGSRNQGIYFWLMLAEALVLLVALVVLVVLFLYFCITFGSMIVKKGKLIISIILFYGVSSAFVSINLFLVFFGALSLNFVSMDATVNLDPTLSLFLLGLIFYAGAIAGLLYSLQYWMLDKKLNLP